jgi:hypothetical protein
VSVEDKVLSRLTKVRSAGKDKWTACCPSHDDSDPSLSISVVPDGRILMHCHGRCDINDVISAMGLQLSDLAPLETIESKHRLSLIHHVQARPKKDKAAPHCDVVVALGESQVARGEKLSSVDKEALKKAIIQKARQNVA